VHRAWLHDGRPVAVKIQYPEIAALVRADLSALDAILHVLGTLEPRLRLRPLLDHLRATLPLELDFTHEVSAMDRLRALLAHRADVVVPEPLAHLSGPRVVVMEFVSGTKITDRAGLAREGIDASALARLLNDVYAEQLLELGVLHADPHPGNLLAQPGPRLVLLDHGLTVNLSRPLVEALSDMVRSLAAGDLAALSDALIRAGLRGGEDADVTTLLALAGALLGGGEGGESMTIARLGHAVGDLPLDLVVVGRVLSLIGGVTRTLDPDLDVLDIIASRAAARESPG
jgi:predicted unusual protein kinase regulating ubiquinone biosynthesis (AarF/ABC1/UbiB family)